MHPIERLRYVARADDAGATLVAQEAALALADLADEPGALVTAVRRLIDFHPECGPLWWVGAQVLAAESPGLAADLAVARLDEDATSEHLARDLALHLAGCTRSDTGSEPPVVVVGGAGEILCAAFEGLAAPAVVGPSIRVVGSPESLGREIYLLGAGGAEVTGWPHYDPDAALDGATACVLEVSAAGAAGVVVPAGVGHLAASAARMGVPVWAVAGVGRVLPARMFDALVERLGDSDSEVVPAGSLSHVVTDAGSGMAGDLLSRSDCPPVPELLRRAR
ncbi:MAG TPA: hypothetical protein VGS21_10280 [Acidimicrobiales bacterium]|nr:hypothetical protein [Acidimicrobiales bacterium]